MDEQPIVQCNDDQEWRLEKMSIVGGPITSVAFSLDGERLFVGQGPNLFSYSLWKKKQDLTVSYRPFPNGTSIHGIRYSYNKKNQEKDDSFMVVFGGRQVAMLRKQQDDDELASIQIVQNATTQDDAVQPTMEISDWIWDARLDLEKDDSVMTLVVALAHNACQVWSLKAHHHRSRWSATRTQTIVCTTRCITYSICLFQPSNDNNDLCLACGTVENEILLWNVRGSNHKERLQHEPLSDDSRDTTTYKKVNHRLKGHQGVIHSVTVAGSYVASTSDDRTVRVYKFLPGQENQYTLLWTGWNGHTARIWDSCIVPSQGVVVSVGEDGTARTWSLRTGEKLGVMRAPRSKSLWTVASLLRNNKLWIATGGNDGTVKIWNLSSGIQGSLLGDRNESDGAKSGDDRRSALLVVPNDSVVSTNNNNGDVNDEDSRQNTGEQEQLQSDTRASAKTKKKNKKTRRIGQVVFGMKFYSGNDCDSRDNKLLVATRGGSLFSYHVSDKKWTRLQPWCPSAITQGGDGGISSTEGSCMAIHESGTLVAIGTTKGKVLLVPLLEENSDIPPPKPTVLSHDRGKSVQGIDWLDTETLIVFEIKGIVILWRRTAWDDPTAMELHRVFCTDTVGVPLSFATSVDKNLLFVGDSRGNIASFHLSGSADNDQNKMEALHPIHTCNRVHKQEHVTDMTWDEHRGRLVSAGNDGCITQCIVDAETNGKFVMALSIPGALSGISRVWRTPKYNLVVGGYYGNEFAIIDVTTGYEFFRVDTGGRQRLQDCFFTENNTSSMNVAFGVAVCVALKDGRNEIMLRHTPSPISRIASRGSEESRLAKYSLGVGLHGETIFDACWCALPNENGDVYILSGSEDCCARLSLYNQNGTVTRSKLLQPHESCVRAVCFSEGSKSSLLVTCGGKQSIYFYVVRHEHDSSLSREFVPVLFLGHGRFSSKDATTDHRINAVKAIPLCSTPNDEVDKEHLVVTGDSNGALHLFLVSTNVEDLRQSSTSHVLHVSERPVLSLDLLRIEESCLLVLAGTTGGDVMVWILPCFSSTKWDNFQSAPPLTTYKAHQMGTNCISATVMEKTSSIHAKIRICSGGDDQAIAVCKARISRQLGETEFELLNLNVTREASSSAVKGVCLVDQCHLVSVGYSQRLALWQLDDRGIHLISRAPVDVGDVNCFAYCSQQESLLGKKPKGVAVGGEGLELFSVTI